MQHCISKHGHHVWKGTCWFGSTAPVDFYRNSPCAESTLRDIGQILHMMHMLMPASIYIYIYAYAPFNLHLCGNATFGSQKNTKGSSKHLREYDWPGKPKALKSQAQRRPKLKSPNLHTPTEMVDAGSHASAAGPGGQGQGWATERLDGVLVLGMVSGWLWASDRKSTRNCMQ